MRHVPLILVLTGIALIPACSDRAPSPSPSHSPSPAPAASPSPPPSPSPSTSPSPTTIPAADAAADLRTLVTELPKLHKDLFFRLPRERWEALAAAAGEELDGHTRAQLAVRLAKLLAAAGDGHTGLALAGLPEFGRLPVILRVFPDGLYVIEAARDHGALRGKKLARIGRQTADEARAAVEPLISRDNAGFLAAQVAQVLTIPEVLQAVGISDRADLVRVETADGAGFELARVASWREVAWHKPSELVPLHRSKPHLAYWNDWLPREKTLYFQYNRCADDPAAKMTFAQLVEGTLGFMNQKPVERFVLDLRDNGGGDSRIAAPLIAALAAHPTLNARGRLLVLIGRNTFSSAVLNALELKKKTRALLVGEPTGGRPSHFGEVKTLTLPRTGWKISYSTKYFTTDLVQGDPDALAPDLPVEVTGAAWFSGRDPVLDAALAFTPGS